MFKPRDAKDSQAKTDPKDASSPFRPPAVSLPKGGGAIRGIDEKFSVNAATGTASQSIPIATSPGRQGFSPQLALSYDSGAGNGSFGLGWSLSLPAITRKTDKGLSQYHDAEESDVFILSGSEDLVPVLEESNGEWESATPSTRTIDDVTYTIQFYRPRIEGLFARIERWTADNGDVHWRSISKDNITTLYGKDADSQIADPGVPSRVFSWLICESYDDKGNAILYEYTEEDSEGIDLAQVHERNRTEGTRAANRYLKHIYYGNCTPHKAGEDMTGIDDWLFEVVFDYGEHYQEQSPDAQGCVFATASPQTQQAWDVRLDPFSSYRAGFEVRTYRLCQRVLMFHHFPDEAVGSDCLVASTDFEYDENAFASFLVSVTHSGYVRQSGSSFLKQSLPPLEFEYSAVKLDQTIHGIDADSLENLPVGLSSPYQWVDLDGEGVSGILTEQASAWYYKRNLGGGSSQAAPHFAPLERVASMPAPANLGGGQQLLDLAGDGQLDVVQFGGSLPGYFERTLDESWESLIPFTSLPNIAWNDPNLRFVDLTGDGHADLLITENDVFTWHLSLAEAGFAEAEKTWQPLDEEEGPRLVFADGTQSIYLADLSGDGLIDLARIHNGEVCYWPSLGYGRFGAKVTMDNAPWLDAPDQFNQQRVRLADIDGSGTTDIIYLGRDSIDIYRNQAGNGWTDAESLVDFPRTDNLSSVTVIDLLGSGTACLVWSSPLPADAGEPMRYVDLMGGQKPHLLVGVKNNLGAETRIHYVSSTTFYLKDKLAGQPWITKLPFPVHVVERVEIFDRISRNYFASRYAYHHGYFDGVEREFRGFGLVEQWDTEQFAEGTPQSLPPKYGIGQVATYASQGVWQFSFRPITSVRPSIYPDGGWFYFFEGIQSGIPEQDILLLKDAGEHASDYVWDGTSEGELAVFARDVPPTATNLDATSHIPPVLTKTWFHTGAYFAGQAISTQFEAEYYREGDLSLSKDGLSDTQLAAMLLDDTVPPDDLSAAEDREACRALKGATLRQEIYALDGSEEEDRPYSVSERNFTIECLQPREGNRHAVFFTHPRETLTFHYERKLFDVGGELLADPRVAHEMVLSVDDYGNVLEAVSIAYGRRHKGTDSILLATDGKGKMPKDIQKDIQVIYTASSYTNAVDEADNYRTPLLSETCTYQLLGLTPVSEEEISGVTVLFDFEGMVENVEDACDGAHDQPYEEWNVEKNEPWRRPIEHVRQLYYDDDDLSSPLTLGTLKSLGLPYETYKLAFTPGLLTQVYGSQVTDTMLSKDGGYVHSERDANWWIPSGRPLFDANAANHFYLPTRYIDPFGNITTVRYDAYDLLLLETEDTLHNKTTIGERDAQGAITPGNDYRVLQAALVTDPNGNCSAAAFDALGMVVGTAVMGKSTENLGDSLSGFTADLDLATILSHLQSPLTNPQAILKDATTRLVYDLFAYQRTENDTQPQPAAVYTLARETHASDLAAGQQTKVQHSFSYSDGFGREIQKKVQAEPGPLVDGGADISPRWVGSGWTIFNNKGKPVRRYEPFFSATHAFEFANTVGVSPILFYDPPGRVVATLHPNHTYEKVVFDPWQQETWDANDTVLQTDPAKDPDVGDFFQRLPQSEYLPTWYTQRSGGTLGADEQSAANKAAAHADTPTVAFFDALGRPFLTVADNGVDGRYATRVELDIEGNQREVIDARGRTVMRYEYYMAGPEEDKGDGEAAAANRVHQESMEAGERWTLNNVAGNPIYAWDSRGHRFKTEYDKLQRPLRHTVRGTDATHSDPNTLNQDVLFEKTEYGENQPNDTGLNLRTRVFKHYDGAGVVTNQAFDFKGNLLSSSRRLAADYKTTPDWSSSVALETETYTSSTTYDALNRPTKLVAPHSDQPGTKLNIIQPTYNEANLLEAINATLSGDTTATTFVADIDYDAKGQRTLIEYGNGTTTEYDYDPETFRLIGLTTTRPATFQPTERVVQDLSYVYDPAGNITSIHDGAQQAVFFNNQVVTPNCAYTYDAIYRLTKAEGREHIGQSGQPQPTWDDGARVRLAHPHDGQAMRNYTEAYSYDEVGNILQITHQASNGNWTRTYDYQEYSLIESSVMSNRLSQTTVGSASPETYTHDDHGNMISMPHLSEMVWDFEDQLQMVDLGGGGRAYYVYDAGGQRVRKVIEGQGGARKEERIYLGGFEVYRKYGSGSTVALERETLHVMDDKQRIALVETRTQGSDGSPAQLIRYQIGNHLGSASLELDGQSQVISYEEYYPYGNTSFQAVRSQTETPKRYRYTGKERDEETGLNYHSARYYAPWLGRWTSVDPEISRYVAVSPYLYVLGNPTNSSDSSGREPHDIQGSLRHLRMDQFVQRVGAAYRSHIQDLHQLNETLGTKEKLTARDIGRIAEKRLWESVNPKRNIREIAKEFDISVRREPKTGFLGRRGVKSTRYDVSFFSRKDKSFYGLIELKKKCLQVKITQFKGQLAGMLDKAKRLNRRLVAYYRISGELGYAQKWTPSRVKELDPPPRVPRGERGFATLGLMLTLLGITASVTYIASGKTTEEKVKRGTEVAAGVAMGTAVAIAARRLAGPVGFALMLESDQMPDRKTTWSDTPLGPIAPLITQWLGFERQNMATLLSTSEKLRKAGHELGGFLLMQSHVQ
ncbi:MAG: hypothetical protein JXB07_10990 [Anaerolineae bacterium]|nr:hypothetical protein [Anaerolineae bacterium]